MKQQPPDDTGGVDMPVAEVAAVTNESQLRLAQNERSEGLEIAPWFAPTAFGDLPDLSVDETEGQNLVASRWRAHIRAHKASADNVELHESFRVYIRDRLVGRTAFTAIGEEDLSINFAIAGNTAESHELVGQFAVALAALVSPNEPIEPVVGIYQSDVVAAPPPAVRHLEVAK